MAQRLLHQPGPQTAQSIIGVCLVLLASAGLACRADESAAARTIAERAAGRAYDGAPPVIPHALVGECATCHDDDGSEIVNVGVAPASPHGRDHMAGDMRRCGQCHVPSLTQATFAASRFKGMPQGAFRGGRATPGAPPTVPHTLHLRENCLSCHSGPASRAEIRTTHPERIRCGQCHVTQY